MSAEVPRFQQKSCEFCSEPNRSCRPPLAPVIGTNNAARAIQDRVGDPRNPGWNAVEMMSSTNIGVCTSVEPVNKIPAGIPCGKVFCALYPITHPLRGHGSILPQQGVCYETLNFQGLDFRGERFVPRSRTSR